jgi:phosphoglycolate phosphatase
MPFQAILFDLDGTLLDTIEDLTDAMNSALAAFGCPPRTAAQCKVFVGDGAENFILRSLPEDRRSKETVAKVAPVYRAAYSKNWALKTRPYEGVPELLDALAARGLKMAVLSNKPDEFTRLMVAKLLPRWRFDAVVGARANWPHKPDPAAALEIAKAVGVDPARFLYLGDTNTDMRTAVAAGMFPVGALWGFRTADELQASGAKALAAKPGDVMKAIEGADEQTGLE